MKRLLIPITLPGASGVKNRGRGLQSFLFCGSSDTSFLTQGSHNDPGQSWGLTLPPEIRPPLNQGHSS